MKLSVITVCRNAAETIGDALESVRRQRLPPGLTLEHVVVDGASSDGTVDRLRAFARTAAGRFTWISEPDRGLYDAMNKGIRLATGDVVGICNADDVLADDDVIARVAAAFGPSLDGVYADVRFARGAAGVDALRRAPTTRYCTGRFFRPWMFRFATFPAHPSTFVRRACLLKAGGYSPDYPICADFELMLRLFLRERLAFRYLPFCTHVMRTGGLSTKGFRSNFEINREDLRALRANGCRSCLPLVYLKYVFKIWGFMRRGHGPDGIQGGDDHA